MKKILLALFVATACATMAPAASINWSATSVKFGTESLKNSTTTTGYLVYLGYNGTLASSYDLSSLPDIESGSVASTTGVNAMSKLNGGDFDVPTATYKDGDAFAMLLSYNDGEKTWWNLSSTVYTISGLTGDNATLASASFGSGFDYATKTESGSSVSKGGGWVAVPEPSTAALALAGLALLLKRRKA